MTDMRGNELWVGWIRFVPPIQDGGKLFGSVSRGYARRYMPGCHIVGFQPSDLLPVREQRRILIGRAH